MDSKPQSPEPSARDECWKKSQDVEVVPLLASGDNVDLEQQQFLDEEEPVPLRLTHPEIYASFMRHLLFMLGTSFAVVMFMALRVYLEDTANQKFGFDSFIPNNLDSTVFPPCVVTVLFAVVNRLRLRFTNSAYPGAINVFFFGMCASILSRAAFFLTILMGATPSPCEPALDHAEGWYDGSLKECRAWEPMWRVVCYTYLGLVMVLAGLNWSMFVWSLQAIMKGHVGWEITAVKPPSLAKTRQVLGYQRGSV